MKTAQDISKAYAEYEALLWMRLDTKKPNYDQHCLKINFGYSGSSGIHDTISEALIKEVTHEAYCKAIDRAIQQVEKRFKEAGIPIGKVEE